MAKFEDSIDIVLQNEGEKFTDIPGDPGGATKWGITLKAAQSNGFCQNVDELQAITRDQAADFYQKYYWSSYYDDIYSQAVATKVFDTGVNVGPGTAVKYLQRAINAVNEGTAVEPLTVDGGIGPNTLAATNAADPDALLTQYRALQSQHYQDWVAADPESRTKFLKGLLNRVNSC